MAISTRELKRAILELEQAKRKIRSNYLVEMGLIAFTGFYATYILPQATSHNPTGSAFLFGVGLCITIAITRWRCIELSKKNQAILSNY